ncbi:hypothetical protein SAMN05444285_106105 [Draconibacterium orientale]|uniref:Uncharacterized protein n=1 Tax=Draconibacterium orientale TaxID=1168034 RepID=X5DLL1_9BACT|nr:hypothetical protein [Draconibacterium orientale]AHW61442.1 hypothetical protein FH5T_01255 [Draconibacterium orientale]SET12897.1 hypothetical protein SAMN05444285_106105 [Draconibacterium orientale]
METKILTEQSLKAKQPMPPEHAAYLELKLNHYIEETPKHSGAYLANTPKSYDYGNLKELKSLAANYILTNFSLEDLWTIFFDFNDSSYTIDLMSIKKKKKFAIDCINEEIFIDDNYPERLKRKVWNMSPLVFGLIYIVVCESKIFLDEEVNTGIEGAIRPENINDFIKTDIAYSLTNNWI